MSTFLISPTGPTVRLSTIFLVCPALCTYRMSDAGPGPGASIPGLGTYVAREATLDWSLKPGRPESCRPHKALHAKKAAVLHSSVKQTSEAPGSNGPQSHSHRPGASRAHQDGLFGLIIPIMNPVKGL